MTGKGLTPEQGLAKIGRPGHGSRGSENRGCGRIGEGASTASPERLG